MMISTTTNANIKKKLSLCEKNYGAQAKFFLQYICIKKHDNIYQIYQKKRITEYLKIFKIII